MHFYMHFLLIFKVCTKFFTFYSCENLLMIDSFHLQLSSEQNVGAEYYNGDSRSSVQSNASSYEKSGFNFHVFMCSDTGKLN